MKTIHIISIALLALLVAISPALADRHTGHGFGYKGEDQAELRLQQMQLMIDLTQEQQERISKIIDESRTRMEPLREQARVNRQEMQSIKKSASFDESRAREIAYQQADTRVSMMALKHETRQQVDAVLTAQQLEKKNRFRELRQQQSGKRPEFR